MVPSWQPAGHLMHFPQLDAGFNISAYTIGWRITDAPDIWTNRFLRFKAKSYGDIIGGAWVLKRALLNLFSITNQRPESTGLITALSSKNVTADTSSPLYRAGNILAKQLGMKWIPTAISKKIHESLHEIKNARDRDAEVHNKYECTKIDGLTDIIILDDFVTRGATFGEITRSINMSNTGITIKCLALAKNESKSYAQSYGVAVDNSHIPPSWDALWKLGQESVK